VGDFQPGQVAFISGTGFYFGAVFENIATFCLNWILPVNV